MKPKLLIVCSVFSGIAILALQQAAAVKVNCHGTAILHFMETATMDSSGVESNASGSISVKRNKQGHADNQSLTIKVGSLQGNTTYGLFASLRTDTNLSEVATFTANAHGQASLKYSGKSQGNGHGGGSSLPSALNPVSNILKLAVVNAATQTVLSVDFTTPDHLQYLIKRCLSNDNVEVSAAASLKVHATESFVQFDLLAAGLSPNATYFLSLNDSIVSNINADAHGNLEFNSLPSGSPAMLNIDSLAILNASSNSVLSTTLP